MGQGHRREEQGGGRGHNRQAAEPRHPAAPQNTQRSKAQVAPLHRPASEPAQSSMAGGHLQSANRRPLGPSERGRELLSLASLSGGSPAPLPAALKPGRAQGAADPCPGDDPTTTASSDSSSPRTRVQGLAPAPLGLTLQRKLPCLRRPASPLLPLPAADHAHFSAPPPMARSDTPR